MPIVDHKNNKTIGVLQCLNKRMGTFTNDDVSFARLLAFMTATVMQNSISAEAIELGKNRLSNFI